MELSINKDLRTRTVEMYLLKRNRFDGSETVHGKSKKKGLDMIHTPDGSVPDDDFGPYLSMGFREWDEFVKAMVKYCNENQIATEKEDHLKGQLESKKEHLNDMREAKDQFFTLAMRLSGFEPEEKSKPKPIVYDRRPLDE